MSNRVLPIFGFNRLRMGIDGNGVRTLVGLYGCPLKCKYCLNPQSKAENSRIMRLTPGELLEKIRIDNLYFQATGGGVTFGGGEPLLHLDGIEEFSGLCPSEWTLWAETSLYVPREAIKKAAELFDHFIIDIKSADENIYAAYTQGNSVVPLESLEYLIERVGPEHLTVRVPLIPGYSSIDDQKKTSQIIRRMGINDIDEFTYIAVRE